MEFLSSVCEDHHENFFALMGLVPNRKLITVQSSKRKDKPKPKRYKMKIPRKESRNKKCSAATSLVPETPNSSNQSKSSTSQVPIETALVPSTTKPEKAKTEILDNSSLGESQVNLVASRAQKNFFHIVANQTASNLKRFLRTNATQIKINETIVEKKFEKKGGPFCGWTALHIASFRGLLDMVSLLLEFGANVNEKASLQSETALAVATWKKHSETVQFLLDNGADVHARNTNRGGQQPIHISCINGDENIIRMLISHGADIHSKTTSYGAQSPIELAARMGHLRMVKSIHEEFSLDIGKLLPYSFLSNNIETIIYALENTSFGSNYWKSIIDESIGFISKAKSSPSFQKIVVIIGTTFNWISSPNVFLFRIIQSGLIDCFQDIARYWINRSSNRLKLFQYNNQTLLYYACACGDYTISQFLLQEANVSPNVDSNGETPLIRCSKEGKIELCSLLLEYGANLFGTTCSTGEIALCAAARTNQYAVCELLLPNGSKEKQLKYVANGMTALDIAASKLHFEVIEVLLNHGADVNSRNPKTNHTPLHYACTMNSDSNPQARLKVLDLLIDCGADLSLKCNTQFGEQGIVELACISPIIVGHLIARGAPEVSVEEMNRKREDARKQLGQILIFDDAMSSIEHKVIHNPQEFTTEQAISEKLETQTLQPKFYHSRSVKTWKTVRLFLSSTFIDMQSERELLVKRIIPRVKEKCAKRNIHLLDIDLRWGVTEEEVQTGKALEVCLQEAKQSDIFCGLLGARYGWVPSYVPESIQNAYQWKENHSITHMEIQEGVMRRFIQHSNHLESSRAFFCFREDSASAKVPASYHDQFIEQNSQRRDSLKQLKQEIISKQLPVISYEPRVEYGSSFPQFGDLESFARDFENQLLKAIDELHPPTDNNEKNPTQEPWETEKQFHQTFIEMRSSSFLGRSKIIKNIEDNIDSTFSSNEVVVVSGEAGSGKSSLMAKIVSKFVYEHSTHETFVLPHFIGGSPSSVSIRNTLNRLCDEIIREFEFSETIATEYEELSTQFISLLDLVSTKGHKRLLIFIDALNQLDASNQSHTLSWLPLHVPENVTIVVSCLPSSCLEVLKGRSHTIHIPVPQLTKSDRNEIIAETLGKYQKKLTDSQLNALLDKPGTTNPLFLTMACEELRIFGNFEKLEEKIFSIAEDVPSLLDQILKRLEDEFGCELVRSTLGLLETSRFGLLEEELLQMNPNLSRFQWAEFFLSIKFYLRPIGGTSNEKVLDFFHRQFSKAVHHRYIEGNPTLSQSLHETLANYFLNKIAPNGIRTFNGTSDYPRGYSEVIFHLFYSKNQFNHIHTLLTSLSFIEKKCLLGFTYDLIRDYILVFSAHQENEKGPGLGSRDIEPFMEFCMSNTHFMDEFPYTILQMAFNQPESSPVFSAAILLDKQHQRLAKSKIETEIRNPIVKWKNKPSGERNRQEYRKLNIGARANSSRGTRDGKLLVVGDFFGRVKLYNASTAEEISVLLQSDVRVTSVDFSLDGKYLIASSGSFVYLFDVNSKTMVQQVDLNQNEESETEILCVAFSGSSETSHEYTFVAGSSIGHVTRTTITSGSHKTQTNEILRVGTSAIHCCCFLPDGSIIVGSSNKSLVLVKGTRKTVFKGHSKAVKGCAAPSNGKWFVSCSQDRLLIVWDISKACEIARLEGHVDMVESCSISPDDRFIISGSWDKRVLLWDVDSIINPNSSDAPVFAVLGEHAHFLNDVHFFGLDSVVSSSADMTVKLMKLPKQDLKSYKLETEGTQNHHSELVCGIDFDPLHQWIATGSWDKHAKLLNASDATQVVHWKDHTKRINDVRFAPASFSFVVTASMDHTLKVWDLESFENTKTLVGHSGNVMAVVVSHDDRYIASGSADKTIKFWDVATGNCIDTIVAHSSWVDTLRFSQTSRMLASASVDGEAKVWNTNNGVLLAHLRKHSAPILDVKWTSGDRYLITVGEDWLIRVWRTGHWDCIRVIDGHKHEVTASVVLDDKSELCELFQCETLLATSSADQTIRFWNYLSGEQLWVYCGDHAYSYLSYVDNFTFVAGDSRGGIHLLFVSKIK